jgi:hypothetical protein
MLRSLRDSVSFLTCFTNVAEAALPKVSLDRTGRVACGEFHNLGEEFEVAEAIEHRDQQKAEQRSRFWR